MYVSTGSGTYTAPVTGYYNICAFLRFKRGGNAVDVTVVAVSIQEHDNMVTTG